MGHCFPRKSHFLGNLGNRFRWLYKWTERLRIQSPPAGVLTMGSKPEPVPRKHGSWKYVTVCARQLLTQPNIIWIVTEHQPNIGRTSIVYVPNNIRAVTKQSCINQTSTYNQLNINYPEPMRKQTNPHIKQKECKYFHHHQHVFMDSKFLLFFFVLQVHGYD